MKMKKIHSGILLTIAAFLGMTAGGWSQEKAVIPLIELNGVPLNDAVKTLARQSNFNFILDPKLSGFYRATDGKMVPQPTVTNRWENKSAFEVLEQLLKEHGLKMVKSPASSVTRITYTNQPVIKVDGDQLGNDTNAIHRMQIDSMPLANALTTIAAQLKRDIVIDPKISQTYVDVSFRWENITAKQALIALCENFDLAVTKDSSSGAIRIKPNEK